MAYGVVNAIKVPVPPGEAQPRDQLVNFEDIQKFISLNYLNSSVNMRMMEGSPDGILYVMPPPSASKVKKTWVQAIRVVTTASTAVPLVATATLATRLNITAKKAAGDNTGNVFIGDSGLDRGVDELHELAPGESCSFDCPDGECFDLADLYADADNNADAVVFSYLPA